MTKTPAWESEEEDINHFMEYTDDERNMQTTRTTTDDGKKN